MFVFVCGGGVRDVCVWFAMLIKPTDKLTGIVDMIGSFVLWWYSRQLAIDCEENKRILV